MRPLAIDLYCGLPEAQLFSGADAAIKKLVAGGAQYPNHVTLSVGRQPPRAVAFERRLVRYLQNAIFAARFAGGRHFGISTLQSVQCGILVGTGGLILGASFRIFPPRPSLSQFARGRSGAFNGAVATVAVRRLYLKVRSAPTAIASRFRRAFVLLSSDASRARGAIGRAPFFVRSAGAEGGGALTARQFVHRGTLP